MTRRVEPPDERIERLERVVRARVESGRTTGMVAGMVLPNGPMAIVAHGDDGRDRPLDENTVLEIGSVTKVFTGTLLAEMAGRGELRLTDPVAGLLPAGVSVPSRGGRAITLEHLATHTSGLPPMPTGTGSADPSRALAECTVERLYECLGQHELSRDPGSRYQYSNLGVGLLGHALALRAGTDYEQLVRRRILEPLEMHRTAVAPSLEMERRLAIGHDARGHPAPRLEAPGLVGAGGLRSSVADMLRFAAANLDEAGSLGPAIRAAHSPRARIRLGTRIGLAWHVLGSRRRALLVHAGGTLGFSSVIGLRVPHRTAVVVLSNSRQSSVEDIGLHLLERRLPLAPAPRQRTPITLPPEVLDRYAGVYEVAGTRVRVTSSAEGLTVHSPGQPADRLHPQTRRRFFFADIDAQVVFRLDVRRRVRGAVLHRDGQRIPVTKVG